MARQRYLTFRMRSAEKPARVLRKTIENITRQHLIFVESVHNDIYGVTLDTTMVATGETRDALFNKRARLGRNRFLFTTGYGPTRNDQSIAQEFDIAGNVHTSAGQHMDKNTPKCSRNPNDVFTSRGSRYSSNTSATRGALAHGIAVGYKTRVRRPSKIGANFHYRPNPVRLIRKLDAIARVYGELG